MSASYTPHFLFHRVEVWSPGEGWPGSCANCDNPIRPEGIAVEMPVYGDEVAVTICGDCITRLSIKIATVRRRTKSISSPRNEAPNAK